MIQVKDLHKSFGKNNVLNGISTDIKKGEVVVVIGPSGSGKSTFLRSLNLLEQPTSGSIIFDGDEITDPKTNIDLHRQKMGMVFQHFNLFPHKTIRENITLAPVTLKKMTKEEADKRADELLERVGLADKANAYPDSDHRLYRGAGFDKGGNDHSEPYIRCIYASSGGSSHLSGTCYAADILYE